MHYGINIPPNGTISKMPQNGQPKKEQKKGKPERVERKKSRIYTNKTLRKLAYTASQKMKKWGKMGELCFASKNKLVNRPVEYIDSIKFCATIVNNADFIRIVNAMTWQIPGLSLWRQR